MVSIVKRYKNGYFQRRIAAERPLSDTCGNRINSAHSVMLLITFIPILGYGGKTFHLTGARKQIKIRVF